MPAKRSTKKAPARKKTAAKKAPARKKAAAKSTATKKTTRKTTTKRVATKKAPVKKKVARKTTKKVTAKKSTAKKKAAPKKASSGLKITQALTKSQLYATIAEHVDLGKKEVTEVFDALADIIAQHVKKRGPQIFTLPGLLKVKVVRKPATKSRKGINPFTGEPTVFKAKPARNVVKVQALKKLKEMVE